MLKKPEVQRKESNEITCYWIWTPEILQKKNCTTSWTTKIFGDFYLLPSFWPKTGLSCTVKSFSCLFMAVTCYVFRPQKLVPVNRNAWLWWHHIRWYSATAGDWSAVTQRRHRRFVCTILKLHLINTSPINKQLSRHAYSWGGSQQ